MRTQRNVTGIAVWLAFLSWMYLVAGMVSPSEVVAQNKVPWYVAQRVASAKVWEISGIISEAIATNPGDVAEIVNRSITIRTEVSETILGAALQAAPEEASKITAGAMRAMAEQQASKPSPPQMVSQQVDQRQLNNQTLDVSDLDPFDPDFGSVLAARILEFTCESLGPVAGFVNFCVVSPAL